MFKDWAEKSDISTDAQYGFKSGYSTVDAVFILKSIIEKQLKVPIAANWKGVCLQNTSKPHSYHLNIW